MYSNQYQRLFQQQQQQNHYHNYHQHQMLLHHETDQDLHHHQQQQQHVSTKYCCDGITQLSTTPTITKQTTSSINPLNSKHAFVAMTTDGYRQQRYCRRSAFFKSFSRNSRTSADSEETISPSCQAQNVLSPKFQRQHKPTHQSVAASSAIQRQYLQPQSAYMSSNEGGVGGCGIEKRKLYSSPRLRITESALRRSNIEKTLESKKRVVKMLFVLVLEFFISWTPPILWPCSKDRLHTNMSTIEK
ncbi:uncharacterized protein [Musca autumnalis]|uniref:uncharacterized protein n=1 Tax=Musca autumnalis TaxID=221902 RepID=UPI003CF7525E